MVSSSELITEPTWTNWAGNVVARPRVVVRPESVDEVAALVREAAGRGETVRVAGAGHSFAPLCASSGTVLDLSALSGIERVDPETGEATILAGTRLYEIGEPLLAVGRAFANQGDIDRQAIAGAVSTGTHGTGRKHGSFAGAVRALELVTASGDLITIDASSDRELRRAVALSLGMLGVITRVTLATVPAYKLRERTEPIDFETCLERFPAIEAERRNAEFWWVPPLDTCVLKSFVETDEEPFAVEVQEHPPGTLERYLKPDHVDWSWRIYPSSRSFPFVELEYTLPLAAGPAAMRAIRDLVQREHPDIRWAVEYRTVPGEDPLLSPTQGEDAVTISVHQAADLPYEAFFRNVEAICLAHGGRPHWGKLHWLDRAALDRAYPEIDSFRRIRRELDPAGIFLNDHLRPLFE